MQAWVIERIVEKLSGKGYEVALFSRNCFDIVAKKRGSVLLVKVLLNVDSFHADQGNDLKKMAEVFSASPVIIGIRGRNFVLKEGSVYERFGIPVVHPNTFEEILDGHVALAYSRKGSNMVKFDCDKLKILRKKDEYSLQQLSDEIGTSKKTLYLAEKYGTISDVILKTIEDLFRVDLRKNIDIFEWDVDVDLKSEVKDSIEKSIMVNTKRVGFTNFTFKNAPANLVLRDPSELVLLDVMKSRISRKHADDLKRFGDLMHDPKAFVVETKKTIVRKNNIDGVAVITSEEVRKVRSRKEMLDLIDDRED
ncbi:MAG: hypothetical protein KAJ47_03950 [Candidatus Aenigmarchaeota archaeon]|nr:hypothetical protein [Candidatus Aenigmarchaeota archaeon]